MKRVADIKEFMDYVPWRELDINEKQALFHAIESMEPINYGLFEVKQSNEGRDVTELLCPLYDVCMTISVRNRASSLKWLEDEYMYGEEGSAYLSWLEQIERDDVENKLIKTSVIHSLPNEEMRVIKKITIAHKARTQIHYATIIYRRQFTEVYNVKDNNPNVIKDVNGNSFPQDKLDTLIFKAVLKIFPDSKLITEYQIFDAERERLNMWLRNRKRLNVHLYLDLMAPHPYLEAEYPRRRKEITLPLYCIGRDTINIFSNIAFEEIIKKSDEYIEYVSLIDNTLD